MQFNLLHGPFVGPVFNGHSIRPGWIDDPCATAFYYKYILIFNEKYIVGKNGVPLATKTPRQTPRQ